MAKDPNYDRNVLAHIAMHQSKGQTDAVKRHMASPIHKAIVDAAPPVEVLAEPDGDQEDPDEGKDKE